MDTVHNMDVVQQLKDGRIRNVHDWLWQKQLRFYLENYGKVSEGSKSNR